MKSIRKTVSTKWCIYIALLTCILVIQFAFCASEIAPDPVTLVYPSYFGNKLYENPDNPLTKQGITLGRMLFYEKALSVNNNISCASCHQQRLAFTDGKTFSKGTDGQLTERNAMSLVNLSWVKNFFWDGSVKGLENQALVPLTKPHEMGQTLTISAQKLQAIKKYPPLFKLAFGTANINEKHISYALAQFERTLISADSKYDQYLQGKYLPTASELRGIKLFFEGNMEQREAAMRHLTCGHCHGGPKTFTELYHNNGLDSIFQDNGRAVFTRRIEDKGRFRVTTLRNIALTAPYMHDGRFKNLSEVLDHYSNHIKVSATLSPFLRKDTANPSGFNFTKQQKTDIINFLHLLTDSTFINNPRFSDPFLN